MARIGVVTSGGDAPGMNAAVRAVVRLAHSRRMEILGFERGWEGLMSNVYRVLGPRSVGGIINRGGTMLLTSRCPEFRNMKNVKKAAENLNSLGLCGLVVIGGNGSFKGAFELSKFTTASIIGVPATIDNDVYGTEETIGFDTAVNTAVSEIDKIRDTAMSHERIFVVEVMGRSRGFLALNVGLTVGSEIILVPEIKFEPAELIERIKNSHKRGKKSTIIVAAEGVKGTRTLAKQIRKHLNSEVRMSVLGYSQRGGMPSARSRYLACLFGKKAVELTLGGERNQIVAFDGREVSGFDLEKTATTVKPLNMELFELARELAT